jgi:hypothetical protein
MGSSPQPPELLDSRLPGSRASHAPSPKYSPTELEPHHCCWALHSFTTAAALTTASGAPRGRLPGNTLNTGPACWEGPQGSLLCLPLLF